MGKKHVARKSSAATKFVSDEAAEKFEKVVSKRPLHLEKGFVLHETTTMGYTKPVYSVITIHNWRHFCRQPEEALIPLVREFYANFPEGQPEAVEVRGMSVDFRPSDINHLYRLEEGEDNYANLIENINEELLQQVISTLCVEGTRWNITAQGTYTFLRNSLLPGPKVWYHFLKSRLMPSTHLQTVSRDRAILLYCIVTGLKFNVGRIIYEEICGCAQKSSGYLWFPSLVSQMCKRSRVGFNDNEETLKVTGIITPAAVARIAQDNLKQPNEAAADDETEEAGPSTRPSCSSEPVASGSTMHFPAEISQSLRMLEQRMSLQEIQQYETMQMLQQMQKQQQQYWTYARQRDAMLQQSLQRRSAQPACQFPEFPSSILQEEDTHDSEEE